MEYLMWKTEAEARFEVFGKNEMFRDALDVLEKYKIELGTNSTYYYYGGNENIVDTRRYIYYKGIGLFKLKIYINSVDNIFIIYIELIRKAEAGKTRIQDERILYKSKEFNKIYNKGSYRIKDKNDLEKFNDDINNLVNFIERFLYFKTFNESDESLKLKSITIYNFKNIKEAKVEFKENMQLLVGINNAGKTSLIQGIVLSQIALNKLYNEKKINFDNNGNVIKNRASNLLSNSRFGVRIDKIPFTVENYRELFNVNITTSQSVTLANFEFQNNMIIELKMSLVGESFSVRIGNISEGINKNKLDEFLDKNITLIPSFFNVTLDEERKSKGRYTSLMKSGNYNQLFRNILYDLKNADEVDDTLELDEEQNEEKRIVSKFNILTNKLNELFGVNDLDVRFDEEHDEYISAKYNVKGKDLDISSLGMGTLQFIQVVAQTLIGNPFLIMLDEPDAHLNAKLQKAIISFFNELSKEYNINLLIATHSKDIINCVSPNQVLIIENGELTRVGDNKTMYDLFNELGTNTEELIGLTIGKRLIFVEGEDDIEYIKCLCGKFNIDKEKYYCLINFIDLNGRVGVLANNLDKYIHSDDWNNISKIAVFDKDYRFDESQIVEEEKLRKRGFNVIGWNKKELENYLINKKLMIRVLLNDYNVEVTEDTIQRIIDEYEENVIENIKIEFEAELRKDMINKLKKEKGIRFKDIDFIKEEELNIRKEINKYIKEKENIDYLCGKDILNKIRCELIQNNTPKASDFVKSLIRNITNDELEPQMKLLLNYITDMAKTEIY